MSLNYKKDFEKTLGYITILEEKIANMERHIYHLQDKNKKQTETIKTLNAVIRTLQKQISDVELDLRECESQLYD